MMISRGVPNPRRRDDGWPLFGRAKRRVRGWKNDAIDLCTSRRAAAWGGEPDDWLPRACLHCAVSAVTTIRVPSGRMVMADWQQRRGLSLDASV